MLTGIRFTVSSPTQSLSLDLNIVLEMVNHWPSMHKVLSVVSSSASMRARTHTVAVLSQGFVSDTAGLPTFTLAETPVSSRCH